MVNARLEKHRPTTRQTCKHWDILTKFIIFTFCIPGSLLIFSPFEPKPQLESLVSGFYIPPQLDYYNLLEPRQAAQASHRLGELRFTLPSSAVVIAKMQTVRPAFEFPGLTEAIQATETRPMVTAEIKAILFAPGQMVNQGDLLVEFDPADYQAKYAVAEAQVKTAKAAATQAISNWERAKELKPDGYISEMQFDEIRAIYDTTRAAVASAEADLQRASLDLERTKVYAPFSGKISRPNYAEGTYVVSQWAVQPQPLFELVQVDVQNRVNLALSQLPEEVTKRSIVVKKRSPDMLMVVNIISPDNRFDGVFLSNYTSLNIQSELARVPGVGEANIIGALNYGMRVWLNPLALANHNLSVNQVLAAIQERNVQAAVGQLGASPRPKERNSSTYSRPGAGWKPPEEFGDIVLRADAEGSVVRLRDVARLELGAETYKGFGEFNDGPGVLLAVYRCLKPIPGRRLGCKGEDGGTGKLFSGRR